jgi:hypothetical protein
VNRTKKNKPKPLQLSSVALVPPTAPSDGAELPNPDWIQIAAEGEYKGHSTGPFTLDAAVFEVIVRNFRNDPRYGGGASDVIAFDFSHASEGDPSTIAVGGAPAQAWAQELEVRAGAKGAELWALTRFLEPMITYRAQGKYKWTSVCVWPDAHDPVSGAKIGWYLSSVAFTNDPFIQGMTPLAAARSFDMYCPPSTPNEVLECLRRLFGLPELAGPDEVMTALMKLQAYAGGAAAPAGVDVESLVGELRLIFNLPTLCTVDEIFLQADALLVALAESGPVSTIAASRKDPSDMNHAEVAIALVASRLKVKLDAKTPETHGQLLCEAIDASEDGAKKAGATALDQVAAICKALGVQDVEAAMAEITKKIQDAAELKRVLPQLAELEDVKKKKEEDAVEEDVDVAMSFRGLNPETRPSLLAHRKLNPEDFEKTYPKPTKEQLELSKKKTPVHAQRGGSTIAAASSAAVPKLPDGTAPTAEMLEASPGKTPSAKGLALVDAHLGGKKLSYDARFDLAVKIARAYTPKTPAQGTHTNAL